MRTSDQGVYYLSWALVGGAVLQLLLVLAILAFTAWRWANNTNLSPWCAACVKDDYGWYFRLILLRDQLVH